MGTSPSFGMSFSTGGSSQNFSGSLQCSVASFNSVSRSFRSSESDKMRKSRIKNSMQNVKKGDMIQIQRTGFLHYAIYIDNGGDVESRDLFETIGDCNAVIDNYLDGKIKPLPGEKIAERALSCIPRDLKYNLGKYNCEHFATWCRYDYPYCHQPCEVAATLGLV